MRYKAMSEREHDEIMRLHSCGYDYYKIADQIGRSYNTVRKVVSLLDVVMNGTYTDVLAFCSKNQITAASVLWAYGYCEKQAPAGIMQAIKAYKPAQKDQKVPEEPAQEVISDQNVLVVIEKLNELNKKVDALINLWL